MAEVTPPFPVEVSNAYNAWDYGAPYKDLIAEGIVGATDLAVTQRGAGANNSVDIAAGTCWVFGDDNPTQQPTYRCYNNATRNLVLTQDATNPRIALIVAHVYDAHFSGATYTWALEAILGTPAGSPVAPALPNNCLLLATVTVPAVGGNVTNAQITDNRVRISDARSMGATNGQVPVWNSTTGRWAPGPPGTGFQTLADVTLGSAAASIDTGVFSASGYSHLKIFAALQDTQAAVSLNTVMRVNNDSTAADYYALNENGINSAMGVGTAIGTVNGWVVGDHPGSSAPTIFSNIEVDIPFSTIARKHGFFSRSMNNADGTNTNMIYRTAGGLHNVSTTITRVAFLAGTTFVIGSRIMVLGYA